MILKMLHLFDAKDASIYNDALNALEDNHPYYKVEFLDIFYDGLKNAKSFVGYDKTGAVTIVMPFYLRPIESSTKDLDLYFDVTSTWGYSGPLYNKNVSNSEIHKFWTMVDDWYLENNVVSEFIRFNTDHNSQEYTGQIRPIMNIVKGQLLDEQVIWDQYNRKVRKNINKGRRENLVTKIFHKNITPEVISDFYTIFIHTMDRTNATDQYYNSKEKLTNFIETCPKNCAIVLTYKEDRPIASEMILLSTASIFSFLGGTLSDYFNMRPNEILKHDVNLWGYKNGYKYYVLGGGLGKEDGIFEYKRAFFPNDLYVFETGRKIINHAIYNQLSANIKKDENDGFFPAYRSKKFI